MANAAEGTPGVVTFINKSTLNLRDSSLKNPQPIQRDSEISIDPKYLKEHLGSETPSLEQIEQLMLNPTEVSKTIVTQSAPDARTGKAFSDYFFPVIVKDKSGKLSNGTMALQAYNRDGLVNIIGDGDQATTSATTPKTRRRSATPTTMR